MQRNQCKHLIKTESFKAHSTTHLTVLQSVSFLSVLILSLFSVCELMDLGSFRSNFDSWRINTWPKIFLSMDHIKTSLFFVALFECVYVCTLYLFVFAFGILHMRLWLVVVIILLVKMPNKNVWGENVLSYLSILTLFAIHWNLKYFKCDEFFRHIIEWCNLILRTHSNPNTCALWQPCTPCKESTPTAATAAASAAEIFFIKRYLSFVYEKANYITVNKNIINSSSISSKWNQCEAEHTEAFEPSHIFSCGSFLVFFHFHLMKIN